MVQGNDADTDTDTDAGAGAKEMDVTEREEIQRDYIATAVERLSVDSNVNLKENNHLVFVSDADEILSYGAMEKTIQGLRMRQLQFPVTYLLNWHFYSLEWIVVREKWGLVAKEGAVATNIQDIARSSAR